MKNFALQLYSARHTPLETALPLIAEAGYTAVEGYGENVKDPEETAALLQKHGLRMISLHVGLNDLMHNMNQTLALARDLDINHLVCPYLTPEQRPDSKDGWSEIAQHLNDICAQINSVGRDFAWHNHDFEFIRLADGSLPMRTLLDEVPEMCWEIDIGWLARVGHEPDSWLRTYPDRISAVHLKDLAPEGECTEEDGWADVGHGTVDWKSVIEALEKSESELFIVEHDKPSDLKRFAERSFQTISSWNV